MCISRCVGAEDQIYFKESNQSTETKKGVFYLRHVLFDTQKFGTEIHHSRWFHLLFLMSAVPSLQKSRIESKKIPWQKSDGLAEKHGAWQESCTKIERNLDQNRAPFFSPSEVWCLPSPSSIKQEEREFVVDSGAPLHMLSRKDLNPAELETIRATRNPTKVITANEKVHTNEEAAVYVKDVGLFVTVQLLEDTPPVLSLGKYLRGSWIFLWRRREEKKTHLIKNGTKISCNIEKYVPIVVPAFSRGDLLRDLPEWLEEFAEHLVDRESSIPEAAGPREPSTPEPRPKVEAGKHDVFTHFPKDRNWEVWRRTRVTQAPCRVRAGNHIPRAENFGDLIMADQKVLNDECESRHSHSYAVIEQNVSTQWLQAYPCKTKTSQETEKSLRKFLIKTDSSLEIGKACEDWSWIIVLRRLTDLRQMVLQNGRYAGWRKVHPRYFCNPV